jgi:hypothetical protein
MSARRFCRRAWLTAQALFVLVFVEVTLRTKGFNGIRTALTRMRPGAADGRHAVADVCEAVDRACSLSMSSTLCLRRSVATALLLRRWGVPAELVLGVTPLAGKGHAWVQLENRVLNDRFFHPDEYLVVDRL